MSGGYTPVISWSDEDTPGLPRYNPDEARQRAELNASRATYSVEPLTYPYMRAGGASPLRIDPIRSFSKRGGNDARI